MVNLININIIKYLHPHNMLSPDKLSIIYLLHINIQGYIIITCFIKYTINISQFIRQGNITRYLL